MTTPWSVTNIPSQRDRTMIVTGGSDGLGYQDALALARAGGDVILAARNPERGAAAVAKIRTDVAGANVRFEPLDLANLASITAFAGRMRSERPRLDLLINNAGIMAPPHRLTTVDGFELQFGLNFLGHFALTAQLLPLLKAGRQPRVVTLSSFANRSGAIRFEDLQWERHYAPMPAYAQSKLADLMFAFELQRRGDAAGWGVTSIGSHPGISRTNLMPNGAGRTSVMGLVGRLAGPIMFQPAAQGALPTLFAATSLEAAPGAYYGPDRLRETRGNVTLAKIPPQAEKRDVAARLWECAEQLTGATFP